MIPLGLQKWTAPIRVLDQGHVRLVDVMGNDEAVVQAARISYGTGESEHKPGGDGNCTVCGQWGRHPCARKCLVSGVPEAVAADVCPRCGISRFQPGMTAGYTGRCVEGDRRLIRYLMRHRHTSPFEQAEIKLHVRVPMDCWRQWIRHRTASVNETSTRYSEAIDAAQRTDPVGWRAQSESSKQGSGGRITTPGLGERLSEQERSFQAEARRVYESRLSVGVAREQARKDLPLSTYTEAYWTIDLHNLLHFLELRLDTHAQLEIRSYAEVIWRMVQDWVPLTAEAFRDYRLEGIRLSRAEWGSLCAGLADLTDAQWSKLAKDNGMGKREVADFLKLLGRHHHE